MSSTNPIEKVCGDLHELMFQHFDKSDVLKASEVSPEWNETISKSSKCMAQIPLRFEGAVPEVISKSQRQYNNLRVVIHDRDQIERQKFELSRQKSGQKIRLVKKFAPFLKHLSIKDWFGIDFEPQIQFPKLQSLKISSKDSLIFVNALKLKKLSLRYGSYNREAVDWIESQEKLEELEVFGVGKFFFDLDPKAPKGIKRFECSICFGLTDAVATKFNNFIEPMCDTLTILKLV
jgi:hypothetical protein